MLGKVGIFGGGARAEQDNDYRDVTITILVAYLYWKVILIQSNNLT